MTKKVFDQALLIGMVQHAQRADNVQLAVESLLPPLLIVVPCAQSAGKETAMPQMSGCFAAPMEGLRVPRMDAQDELCQRAGGLGNGDREIGDSPRTPPYPQLWPPTLV